MYVLFHTYRDTDGTTGSFYRPKQVTRVSLVHEVGKSTPLTGGNSAKLHCKDMDKERPLIEAIRLINPPHLQDMGCFFLFS